MMELRTFYEEVWQYGSNESEDPDYKQDGIAPQCSVPGLDFDPNTNDYGRIPFLGDEKYNFFLEVHYNENYRWVLNILPNIQGYVKKRD